MKLLLIAASVLLVVGCNQQNGKGGTGDRENPGQQPGLQPGEVYDRGGAPPVTNSPGQSGY
ncbi:MAG TPA: hypothetical protein VEC99_18805 [Clostridia bacterium]|nr:hypothetical protein [Clostridia bacterium]